MEGLENISSSTKAFRPQVMIAFATCLIGIAYGMSMGHSAVLLPLLRAENGTIVVHDDTASWIASVYALSSPAGCLLGGVASDIWGRRKINIIGNTGMVLGWIFIALANNVAMLICGRILEGFTRSLLATIASIQIDELAEAKYRGCIVISVFPSISIGIMAISALGALVEWRTASGIAALVSLINLIGFMFVPETPSWFVRKSRFEEAKRTLFWLWGPGKEIEAKQELEDLRRLVASAKHGGSRGQNATMKKIRGYFVARVIKPFLILHIFNTFQIFCGFGIFTYYTIDIISNTKRDGFEVLDDYTTNVIISAVRVVTVVISLFCTLKLGRRTLSLTSGVLASISAVCLGVILLLRTKSGNTSIPADLESKIIFILILFYAGSMSFGLFSLPISMIGETQPSHTRAFVCGYIYTTNDLFVGGVVKLYPLLLSSLQIHGLFLFFGISCVCCSVFVYLFLPETQGRTLAQIEDYFKQKNVMWITRRKYTPINNATENKDSYSLHL